MSEENEEQFTCEAGTQAGIRSINSLWANFPFYSDCTKVWDLPMGAEMMKNDLYPLQTAYDVCARDLGVDPQVALIEEQCLGDDPQQCIDLGEEAASTIVYQNVCMTSNMGNYQEYWEPICLGIAIDICEGSIAEIIQEQCPSDYASITTIILDQLMGMCEGQVNDLVSSTTGTPTSSIPTKMPTNKPNNYNRDGRGECRGGYPYESGSFCFTARQQCCSSVKKYDMWESFCLYYGLPYPDELSGSITPWTFSTIDCAMCGSTKCPSDDIEHDIEVFEAELDGNRVSNDEESGDFVGEDFEDAFVSPHLVIEVIEAKLVGIVVSDDEDSADLEDKGQRCGR